MGKKLFKKFVLPVIGFVFTIVFLFAVMISIFNAVKDAVKDFFNFGDVVSANAEQVEELISNGSAFKDGYDEYLNDSNMGVYIDNEKKGYLENIAAKKKIVKDGVVSYQDIIIDMAEQKFKYYAPWQLYMLVDFFSDDTDFGDGVHENVSLAQQVFTPKFHGLKTASGEFKYNAEKTVRKRIVREEYKKVGTSADGSPIYAWVVVSITTTETTETTPLPYFDKIEAYDNTYEYKYKTEVSYDLDTKYAGGFNWRSTTTITTTDKIPKLIETNVTSNVASFYTNLSSFVGYADMDAVAECYSYLPQDSRFSLVLSELSYNGTIFSPGLGGGIPLNHDFTLPSIVNSNNTTISKTELISVSTSLLGLHYEWGGKYHRQGLNPNWGKTTKGLDCSGFVDWVFTQFGVSVGMSTGQIYSNGQSGVLVKVSRDNLKIGDIGLDYVPGGGGNNHTGVVIGFENGQPLIAHAAGPYWGDAYHPTGQVVISKLVSAYRNISANTYMGYKPVTFSSFYRVQGLAFK